MNDMSSPIDTTAAESVMSEASPKRRQVIEAAAALFIAHGYGAVSMDAVARKAGVSKATLYAHFASKDQLFASIVSDAARLKALAAQNFPDHVDDIAATLLGIGGRMLRFMLQPQTLAIYRIAVAESVRFPEVGQAFMLNGPLVFRARFAAWVALQNAAGHLAAPDPVVAAEQFSALMRSGVFLRASLAVAPAPTEAEIDATVQAAVATFLQAFGPKV